MVKVTPEQVYSELRMQGMSSFEATTFLAIVWRETGGSFETTTHNDHWWTLDDSWGLYQINHFGGIHLEITVACATELKCSTGAAIKLYRAYGTNRNAPPMWGDWKVYKNEQAMQLTYWGDAKKIADKLDASGAYTGPDTGGAIGNGPTSNVPGSITIPGIGTIPLPFNPQDPASALLPGQKDITDLLKDIMLVGIWLLIGMVCIVIGLWGVVNQTDAGKQVIDGAKKAAFTAAKVAVLA